MPYINASIILQLLATTFPSLKKLQREEGPQVRRLPAGHRAGGGVNGRMRAPMLPGTNEPCHASGKRSAGRGVASKEEVQPKPKLFLGSCEL